MMQTNIFDICERKHGGNKQSRAAFDRLAPKLAESQQAVLSVIRNAGLRGATNKEIAQLLGWAMHRVSGRRTELLAAGAVIEIDQRRDGGGVVIASEFREAWESAESKDTETPELRRAA